MATLPLEVITDILLRLPAKTLLRFKSVCKSWYDLINGPFFIGLHLKRSLETQSNLHFVISTPVLHLADFDTLDNPMELNYPFKVPYHGGADVVGSCHGLLCLWNRDYHLSLFLYNPTTQTHKLLPFLPITPPFYYCKSKFDFGFGYDSASRDYKCVRILQNFDKDTGSFESEVMVYSLNFDSWRRAPDVPYYFYYHNGDRALVNETIHWVAEDHIGVPLPIVAFNLRDETFSSIPLPNFCTTYYIGMYVGELEGCLCLCVYLDYCDVWVMKEYGVAGSWMFLFSVKKRAGYEDLERPIFYSMSKKELFVRTEVLQVAYIDMETMETMNVKVGDFYRCLDAHVCVENLLKLEDAGQKKSKRRRRRKKNKR